MRLEISGTRSVFRGEYTREAAQLVTARGVGPSNIKGGRIVYRRQKTAKNPSGVLVDIPMHLTCVKRSRRHLSRLPISKPVRARRNHRRAWELYVQMVRQGGLAPLFVSCAAQGDL